jgi:hypothetical protein
MPILSIADSVHKAVEHVHVALLRYFLIEGELKLGLGPMHVGTGERNARGAMTGGRIVGS